MKYKTDLINAYNNFIAIISNVYDEQTAELKESLHRDFNNVHKPTLISCLEVLNLTATLPANFIALDINTVTEISKDDTSTQGTVQKTTDAHTSAQSLDTNNDSQLPGGSKKQSKSTPTILSTPLNTDTTPDKNNSNSDILTQSSALSPKRAAGTTQDQTVPPEDLINTQNQATMVQTRADFLKEAGAVFNYKFNGDPMKLESFLADVAMVVDIAEEPQKAFCLTFIKAKLEQKALECLPDEIETVKDITDALRKNAHSSVCHSSIKYFKRTILLSRKRVRCAIKNGSFCN